MKSNPLWLPIFIAICVAAFFLNDWVSTHNDALIVIAAYMAGCIVMMLARWGCKKCDG